MEHCINCGGYYSLETHHIIKRSQVKSLINCKLNKVLLCPECHRGKNGVHTKDGRKLDLKLRYGFQNKLELLFLKNEFTREEIRQALKINNKATNSLCKLMKQHNGVFARDEIIIACMGGQRIDESEVNDESTN